MGSDTEVAVVVDSASPFSNEKTRLDPLDEVFDESDVETNGSGVRFSQAST
jgi:hypothetical protein